MLSSKPALFSLRRIAFWGTISILLAISFAQFAVATDGNISISGIKFLDANSNGKLDPSEQPLQGYTIYIHKDNTGQLQQGDPVSITDAAGKYGFINIPKTGFVRELVSSGDQFHPSSPINGYNLADVTNETKDKLDFGNSMPMAADSASNRLLLISIGIVALFIILGGGYVLFKGLSKLDSLTNEDIKKDRKTTIQIVCGFILLILGLYLLISLAQISRNPINGAAIGTSSLFLLITPALLAFLAFGAVLLMLYAHFKLREDEPGVMRKTIAGLLVVGLLVVIFFALTGEIKDKSVTIISQYIELVGIIIAFYFGSRAAGDVTEKANKIASAGAKGANKSIDMLVAEVKENDPQTRTIKVVNKQGKDFKVSKVTIEDVNTGAKIEKSVDPILDSSGGTADVTIALTDAEKIEPNIKHKIIVTTSLGDAIYELFPE